MLKTKVVSVVLCLTVSLGILAGCSKSEATSSSGKLVDGTYKVEYDNFDTHGYKPQLELTVSGSKITEVKYDEVMQDGTLKSKDAQYKIKMEESSKTYPEKAYSELKQQLLTKQSSTIDVVSGATASSNSFKELVKYAFDKMIVNGKTTSAKIPMPK